MKKYIFPMALAMLTVAAIAFASYTTGIYKEQGGDKMVVASGGEIEVQSGGVMDLQSGASFNVPTATNSTIASADTAGKLAYCTNCDTIGPVLLACNGTAWLLAANGTLPDNLAQ